MFFSYFYFLLFHLHIYLFYLLLNYHLYKSKDIKEGLKDRAVTRDLSWGVDIPIEGFEDKKHRVIGVNYHLENLLNEKENVILRFKNIMKK